MQFLSTAIISGLLASTAAADAIAGFNSGSTFVDGSAKQKSDFEAEFKTAANLKGAPTSFNAVRLYTMVQGGTTSDPLSAFEAAIGTNTKMLLGIWCSGTTTIQNDLDALSKAIKQYGSKFADLVIGISVGSEDLYRNSATGVANKAGVGADPSVVAGFIKQVRSAVSGTVLAKTPIGHVDTWDVWGNSSNKAVLDAIDFLGTDAYPYFESNRGDNSINNSVSLWNEAIDATRAAAAGKPVWVTETGWPYAGPAWGKGVASVANAKQYWDDVGCTLFGKTNTFWFTLDDTNPADKAQFAITEGLSTTPRFNLTCPAVKATTSTTSSGSTSTNSASNANVSGSGSGSGSGSSDSGSSGSSSGSTGSASTGTSGSSGTAGAATSNTSTAASSSSSPARTGAASSVIPSLFAAAGLAAAAVVFAF